jgi:dienelactone hydrolase
MRRVAALLIVALAAAPAAAGEIQPDAVLSAYPTLATNAEIARRVLSPLANQVLHQRLSGSGQALSAQAIDLAKERYLVFTPAGPPPPGGWGLLVFVPPWDQARLPAGWAQVLEKQGLLFVTPAHAGNDQSPLGRREPLALAALGLMNRLPIDRRRVYVGGFSGGSRMALRLALAYPDVFSGALLNAGSDPIGQPTLPLPPADLFERFQTHTRLVFATGLEDTGNLNLDAAARRSLREHCVAGIESVPVPRQGHAPPDPTAFAEALRKLEQPPAADTEAARACRASLKAKADAAVADAEAALAAGHSADARARLEAADRRYGGLTATRALALAARLPPS